MDDAMNNELLTNNEAAKFLRRSKQTLRRLRVKGELSYVKNGTVQYRLSDLERFLKQNEHPASK